MLYLIARNMAKYKKLGSVTLFDAQNTKENLSRLGNPLERLSQVVDFEMFRDALEDVFENKAKKNNAGAKPYDVVMMFKVMVIKHYYNLSDHQVQYQITDRQSFKDFLGLASGDKDDLGILREDGQVGTVRKVVPAVCGRAQCERADIQRGPDY